MNCSVKFLEPTVSLMLDAPLIGLIALAAFSAAVGSPSAVVAVAAGAAPVSLLLSSPHAATKMDRLSTAKTPSRMRIRLRVTMCARSLWQWARYDGAGGRR